MAMVKKVFQSQDKSGRSDYSRIELNNFLEKNRQFIDIKEITNNIEFLDDGTVLKTSTILFDDMIDDEESRRPVTSAAFERVMAGGNG
ncbi:MAG: hypothetical protein K6E28_11175 [Eubacterium sp.]|nr:hypothetical protein [Eubacterium sp.]